MKKIVVIAFALTAVALHTQEGESPDPAATQVFQVEMNETLTERAFRLDQLYQLAPDDRLISDTEIDVINGRSRFRQALLSTGSRRSAPVFAEIDLYNNGPVTPLRIGMGLHNSFTGMSSRSLDWSMLPRFFGAPFSTTAEILRATRIYGREDVYEGYYHMSFDVWAFPYTSNFIVNYPDFIRAKAALGAGEEYTVPTEGWSATVDGRIVDYIHTRYFRGLASWSWQVLIERFVNLLTGNDTAVRLDGEISEYRWFGEDEFAVYNELSAELDLAALLRTGDAFFEDRAADSELSSVYALAQRVIEGVENQLEEEQRATKDVTRYGMNLERLPLPGTPDLYAYLSQLNQSDATPQFWEIGLSWSLGPLALRGNGILPARSSEQAEPPFEAVYGAGAELGLDGGGWRFSLHTNRIARLSEAPFYEAGVGLDTGLDEERFGLVAEVNVNAPVLNLDTRDQHASLGLRLRDTSFTILGRFVENLLLEARLNQAIREGERTRSVLAVNLTTTLE